MLKKEHWISFKKQMITKNSPVIVYKPKTIDYYYHVFLFFFCFMDFYFSIFGFQIKVFYIISLPAVFQSIIDLFLGRSKIKGKIDFLIILWIASSWLSFSHIISLNDMLTCFFGEIVLFLLYKNTISFLLKYHICLKKSLNFIANSITIFAAIGIMEFLLYVFFKINIGINHINTIGFPRPSSVFSEPDWLGFYSMIGSLILFVGFLCDTKKSKTFKYCSIKFLICFASLFVKRESFFDMFQF